jgi:hypothetical protein
MRVYKKQESFVMKRKKYISHLNMTGRFFLHSAVNDSLDFHSITINRTHCSILLLLATTTLSSYNGISEEQCEINMIISYNGISVEQCEINMIISYNGI